jgi:hypothetical protein
MMNRNTLFCLVTLMGIGVPVRAQFDWGMGIRVDHEQYAPKRGVGMVAFDVFASYTANRVYVHAGLGLENSLWNLHPVGGDGRLYTAVNRLNVFANPGVKLVRTESFFWAVEWQVRNGFSFRAVDPYVDVTASRRYRLSVQPGFRFNWEHYALGLHTSFLPVSDFSIRPAMVFGGSFAYRFYSSPK